MNLFHVFSSFLLFSTVSVCSTFSCIRSEPAQRIHHRHCVCSRWTASLAFLFSPFPPKIERNEFSNLNDFTHFRKWGKRRYDKRLSFFAFRLSRAKRSGNVIQFSFDWFIRQIQELGVNGRHLIFTINIDINIIWFRSTYSPRSFHFGLGTLSLSVYLHATQTDVPFGSQTGVLSDTMRREFKVRNPANESDNRQMPRKPLEST